MSSARSILDEGPAAVGLTAILFLICLVYRLSVIESLISEPDILAMLMNMLGLAFYCAAIYVFASLPKTYRVLVLYFLLASMHWGGPELRYIPPPYGLLIYLLVSSITSSILLLYFALDVADIRLRRSLLFVPAWAMLVVIGILPFGFDSILEPAVEICMLIATGIFPVAAVILLLKYVWPTPLRVVIFLWLSPIIIATIGAMVPGLDLFNSGYEPLNVLYVAEIAMLVIIARFHMLKARDSDVT